MRICCLATQTPDHVIGGMAQQTTDLAADLVRHGHDVTLVTTRHPRGIEHGERDGVRVHYLGDTAAGAQSPAWWRGSTAAFRRLHREKAFDVLWSQSVAAAGVARTLGAGDPPLVPVIQGTAPEMIASILASVRHARTRAPLRRTLRRLAGELVNYATVDPALYRRAALVVPVSRTVAAAVRRWYRVPRARIEVVGNATDPARFHHDPARRAAVRGELGLAPGALVLLTVGVLGEQKGVDLAIDALARLARPDARLLAVGDGPLRGALEAFARNRGVADRVRFVGAVAHADVARFYGAADVFLFPTLRREGLPGVAVEAMACELPVVASRTGTNAEVVEDGATGYLVKPGDAAALAERVARLAADPERARAMGRAGRARMLERWTPEARVRRIVALFDAVRAR